MVKKISKCRICGNKELIPVVDLGEQYLTGIFPISELHAKKITKGPLRLVKCHSKNNCCGLLQLEHSYDLDEMYGDNYGYRSGLNKSMVEHLHNKVHKILSIVDLDSDDLVIDIGSNDGTTLSAYNKNLTLIGIDPTGNKFKEFYPDYIKIIPDFFTDALVRSRYPDKKAKIVTSFSMFYDLESPQDFVNQISNILDSETGLWVFEQSYMPSMIEKNSYDTICHEHLEYYGISQIIWLLDKANMKIIDVETNDINGGSFSISAAHNSSIYTVNSDSINRLVSLEKDMNLFEIKPYLDFQLKIDESRDKLRGFFAKIKENGMNVSALGASTKGNVILQYCGIDSKQIDNIGEVNDKKYGALTPGSMIPIKPEEDVLNTNPDYLLVLPWHFKEFFLKSSKFKGRKLIFPLPELEIINL
jgi:hypothetical protein